LVLKESGEVIVGLYNHKPKGPHLHRHGKEQEYDYMGQDGVVDEFWDMVKEEGFQL